jgi:hypothetical protein
MEHIKRPHHDKVFDFLAKHCGKTMVFSGATIGQQGLGHVAERPEREWRQELEKRGLVLDRAKMIVLRETAQAPWYKKNLMVFNRT